MANENRLPKIESWGSTLGKNLISYKIGMFYVEDSEDRDIAEIQLGFSNGNTIYLSCDQAEDDYAIWFEVCSMSSLSYSGLEFRKHYNDHLLKAALGKINTSLQFFGFEKEVSAVRYDFEGKIFYITNGEGRFGADGFARIDELGMEELYLLSEFEFNNISNRHCVSLVKSFTLN